MPLSGRITRLAASFPSLGVDAILVDHAIDIAYLTGYPAHDAWLLVTPRESFYITDGRYIEEVKKVLRGITPVQFKRSIFEDVAACCRNARAKRLGVDERRLTVHEHKRLRTFCAQDIVLRSVDGCIDRLRAIKDKSELKLMGQALRLNLKAYRFIAPYLKPGVRECDILHKLEEFIRRQGVAFAFDPIIASGPNCAYPHARVTDRKFRHKDCILIDLGIDYKGYKSDLTRMFFLGKMPASYSKVLAIVHEAQNEAIRLIKPGVAAKDVDAAVREHLKKYALAEYFTHSLGHGVGLEVHEGPRLSVNSDAVLQENMVCTVEPGVYFPGKYGVRLEEMVLVTKKGCEVLSRTFQ